MTPAAPAGRTDRAVRTIAADSVAVYRALVEPGAVAEWLPPDGMRASVHAWDARPGGPVDVTLRYLHAADHGQGKTSADTDVVRGRFLVAVPGERVAFAVEFEADDPALSGTMTMTWSLTAAPDGTRVEFLATDVPPGIDRAAHETALRSTLEHLAAHVERSAGTPVAPRDVDEDR